MAKQIVDLCQEICQAPAPVVMLDTCAVLDVIRAPIRPKLPPNVVLAAQELTGGALLHPRTVWLVATETILNEWQDHRDATAGEVLRQLRRIDNEVEVARVVAGHSQPARVVTQPGLGSLGLETELRQTAQEMLDAAEVITTDEQAELRAGRRVQLGRAPSSKGKSEYKDCLIFEHYLALSHCLQQAGYAEPRFLVTSNIRDYGNPTGPDNPLAPDLAAVSLQYVTDLWWLRSEIR